MARKVAIRANKGMLDQATRGEKRVKEEEQKLRKLALNISKDVKKFWTKIEKLVLYKHQLELYEKKKKALDKQLEFLLGQTESNPTCALLKHNLVVIRKEVMKLIKKHMNLILDPSQTYLLHTKTIICSVVMNKLDEGIMSPDLGPLDYKSLYKAVGKAIFKAHAEIYLTWLLYQQES